MGTLPRAATDAQETARFTSWRIDASDVSLEELVLGYMGQDAEPTPAQLITIGEDQ